MKNLINSCKKHPRLFAGLFGVVFGLGGAYLLWGALAPLGTSSYTLLFLQYLLWVFIVLFITHILRLNKWLSLLGFLGWIIVDIILSNRKKKQSLEELQKIGSNPPSSTVQFLGMFIVIGFAIYGGTTNSIGWIISLLALIATIWYTKRK